MKKQIPYGTVFVHYKGDEYLFLFLARNKHNFESVVVYSDKAGNVWVRPSYEFFGIVQTQTGEKQRFTEKEV